MPLTRQQRHLRARRQAAQPFAGILRIEHHVAPAHRHEQRLRQLAQRLVAEDRNGAEARAETTIDGVHQRKLSPIGRRRIGGQRPDDAAAHQRAAGGPQQQQWQDPRQDVLLAADAGRAQQRQPLDPRRPPHGEVQRQPRAQRDAEARRARHAQSIEHGLQPGRVRIARQRQPRRRARAGLADQVDRVNAEMRRPGRGLPLPAGGRALRAMQQHQGRGVLAAAHQHMGVAGRRRHRHSPRIGRPMGQRGGIGLAHGFGVALGLEDQAHAGASPR
ncbi:Uncharacterised protein [Achromobacter xylosoxidans]|nr:Uncharacterised protein [Achromobacter xylosoxidans]